MRWSASLLAIGCVLATGIAPGAPLPYHSGERAVCSDCHEASQGDGASAAGASASSNALCLRCHDDRVGIPDVLGDDRNRLRERSGGFFGAPGTTNAGGHDLAGEGRHGNGVLCVDCHDPHGGGTPRILRVPSQTGSMRSAGAPVGLGLFVSPRARGLERYERGNVAYGTLDDQVLREASFVCLGCHEDLAGNSLGPGRHATHPTYNSLDGQRPHIADGSATGATDPLHWRAGEGYDFELVGRLPVVVTGAADYAAATRFDPSTSGVFCLTCHFAHGGEHSFAMRWDYGRSVTARAGCDQCHAVDPMPQLSPLTAQRP